MADIRCHADSKIDLLDPPELVAKKIKKAEAAPGVTEGNGILAFAEFVLLPAAGLKGKRELVVTRERDGLEPLVYTKISQMHEDYKNDIVSCPTGGVFLFIFFSTELTLLT